MRKLALFFCLFHFCFTAFAQESKWAISFTPTIVLNSSPHYAVQTGIQYYINERLSILSEVTFPTSKNKDLSYKNSKYFRIKPELRYDFPESKWGLHTYAAFQLSYSYRKWDDQNGGYYFDKKLYSDSSVSYSSASVKSPIITSSIQIGQIFSLSNHFFMDIFMGLGARSIFTNYSDVQNPSKQPYFNIPRCKPPAPDPAYWVNGTVIRFHSNLGFRILYRF
jgi:hypothetical protein